MSSPEETAAAAATAASAITHTENNNNSITQSMKEDGWMFDSNDFIGKPVRTLVEDCNVVEGVVLCYKPPNKDRQPPLWRLKFDSHIKDVIQEELQECLELATKRWGSFPQLLESSLQKDLLLKFQKSTEERHQEALAHYCEFWVLPKLCILAALEESLHQLLLVSGEGGGGESSTTTSTLHAPPPRYYSLPPSHYLQPMELNHKQEQQQQDGSSGFAPSALAQRIRQGAHLAWNYHYQQMEAAASDRRRSKRLPMPTIQKPQPVQRGGRIAMYLLELLEKEQNGSKDNNGGGSNNEEEEADKEESQHEEKEEVDEDDENETEGVEEESEEEESEESEEEEEESDDIDVIYDNPYLIPSFESVLDWLGRRGKSMTGLDVQHAICRCLVGLEKGNDVGLAFSELQAVDEMVLPQPPHSNARIVLECTTGDKLKDLPQLEVTSFARCKFALSIFDKQQKKQSKREKMEEFKRAELIYKSKKAWATWRFKSIHGGYAKWPMWTDAVQAKWNKEEHEDEKQNGETAISSTAAHPAVVEAFPKDKPTPMDVSSEAAAAVTAAESTSGAPAAAAIATESTTTATPAATTMTESTDLALAQSLQNEDKQDTGGTRRRTTRRLATGSDAPVFYGGQSNMTQKQLMDTVLRLLDNAKQPQSLIKIMGLVAEESTNPLQRLRVAMGKLLWKLHAVAKWNVASVWSDESLYNVGPLWVAMTTPGPAAMAIKGDEKVPVKEAAMVVKEDEKEPAIAAVAIKEDEKEPATTTVVVKEAKEQASAAMATKEVAKEETTAAEPIKEEEKESTMDVVTEEAKEPAGAAVAVKDEEPTTAAESVKEEEKESTMDVVTEEAKEPAGAAVAVKEEEKELPSKKDDAKVLEQQLNALVSYLHTLHQTELSLRRLVLSHLTSIPLSVVATAADERPGSLEAMDTNDFLENADCIEWTRTGHDYLKKRIYRPPIVQGQEQSSSSCRWYEVQEYCPSVLISTDESTAPDNIDATLSGKKSREVERRMRFHVISIEDDEDEEEVDDENSIQSLVLTQAQVHAGLEAAALQQEQARQTESKNPFSNNTGANITLAPMGVKKSEQGSGGNSAQMACKVVGYDTVLVAPEKSENGATQVLEHRILILPNDDKSEAEQTDNGKQPHEQATSSSDGGGSVGFWATVNEVADGTLTCRPMSDFKTCYKIGQSDYHPSSRAFQECQAIVDYLKNHHRSSVFMEPVDPVALNIPDYFDVIKHPMDISTLESNLEKGLYSKIPPSDSAVGQTPVARMLNGPFKDDVVRIFDNATLFNPPGDWIHTTAASMKKSVLSKIETASQASYHGGGTTRRWREKKSVYVDEDSDVDMYVYESDRDDEDYDTTKRSRKRKHSGRMSKKEDNSTRAIEHPVRLHKTLSESAGVGGPFADMPIQTKASAYTLPPEWSCRHQAPSADKESSKDEADSKKRSQEMMELLALYREVEETERASLRRSTRSHATDEHDATDDTSMAAAHVQYVLSDDAVPPIDEENFARTADSRSNVETARETMHESYYAKLFQDISSNLTTAPSQRPDSKTNGSTSDYPEGEMYGLFVNDSFPPFLGRIVPSSSDGAMLWEIRSPYVIAALRWVIRGLIQSGHLSEIEPLLVNDSPLSTGVILANNVYHCNENLEPFDVLDVKEMQRRRRANNAGESSDESEDFEMSEYEKLRAERVARNRERLKALGLA